MIDVKQAVASALRYMSELYANEKVLDLRLEEVEHSEDDRFWLITLSYLREVPTTGVAAPLARVLAPDYQRDYKTLKIDADSGTVDSMKIRTLA
jgi:hypothetical protein